MLIGANSYQKTSSQAKAINIFPTAFAGVLTVEEKMDNRSHMCSNRANNHTIFDENNSSIAAVRTRATLDSTALSELVGVVTAWRGKRYWRLHVPGGCMQTGRGWGDVWQNTAITTLNHPQTPNPQHNPHTPTSQTSPGRKTGVLHRGILFRAPYKIDSTNYAGLPLGTLVFKTIII